MKKLLLIFALLAASRPAYSQLMDDGTVQIIGYWCVGDKYDYDYSKTKSNIIDGDTTVVSTITERLTFEVVDSTATSYTLQLTFSNMRSSDPAEQRRHDLMTAATPESVVLLQTDHMGSFQKIANLDECMAHAEKAVEIVIPAIYADMSEEQKQTIPFDRFADMVKGTMCDPAAFRKAVSDYIGMFFFYHGARLYIGHEYAEDSTVQGLFGGTAQTTVHFWADEELTDAESAVMYTYNEMDIKDIAIKSMDNIMQAMGTSGRLPEGGFSSVASGFQTKIEDYSATEVHLDSGWPLNILITRDITVADENGKEFIIEQSAKMKLAD